MIQLEQLLLNPTESLTLTAKIDSALCVGAGGASGSLADKPIIRTAKGTLLIPASQLKGRLRHECEKLSRGLGWSICESPNPQTMCPQRAGLSGHFERPEYDRGDRDRNGNVQHHCLICQIFGNPTQPASVLFDDLVCHEEPENLSEVLRPGVTINRRRQTAEDRKLYFLETSPANAQLQFTGSIHFLSTCPDYARVLILAGLQHIHALGGSKSAGLGWLSWEPLNLELDRSAVWEFLAKGATS
ncbi:MAG: RAMP superfamily CRISPR-associated protein [Desertifilum sp.]|nr:RAMP superfamily CRISPR-associated protein [Desertifilum sp.]